jgi:hypothetical protein
VGGKCCIINVFLSPCCVSRVVKDRKFSIEKKGKRKWGHRRYSSLKFPAYICCFFYLDFLDKYIIRVLKKNWRETIIKSACEVYWEITLSHCLFLLLDWLNKKKEKCFYSSHISGRRLLLSLIFYSFRAWIQIKKERETKIERLCNQMISTWLTGWWSETEKIKYTRTWQIRVEEKQQEELSRCAFLPNGNILPTYTHSGSERKGKLLFDLDILLPVRVAF